MKNIYRGVVGILFLMICAISAYGQCGGYPSTANIGLSLPTTGSTSQWGGCLNVNSEKLDLLLGGTSTLTVNSATPSVSSYKNWVTANTSSTTITNFTGGYPGQQITVISGDTNTTIATSSNIKTIGSWSSATSSGISFTLSGSIWYETGRAGGGGSSSGTVTTVGASSGTGSPLFSVSVANPTTTPNLSFTTLSAAADTVYANPTGSSAPPIFTSSPALLNLSLLGYQDFTGISVPGNPSSGNGRVFFNPTTSLLQCLTSTGANCLPSGSGTSAFSGGLGSSYQDIAGITGVTNPASGNARLYFNSTSASLVCLTSTGGSCLPVPSSSFASLSSGVNGTAAMVIGSGGSLSWTANGTIDASSLGGATFAAPGPIGGTTPSSASFSSLTLTNVTSPSPQCLHSVAGQVQGTGADCGSGGGATSLSQLNGGTAPTGQNYNFGTNNFSAVFVGPRPWIDVTSSQYGATGDNGAEQTTGSMTNGSSSLTVANATGFQVGMGIHVDGAGSGGDVLVGKIVTISGTTFTLSVTAGTSVTNASVQDDDTVPIQQAMAAFCAGGASAGGSIYFPPGAYIFSQPQAVNPNAYPFAPGCSGMHFLGGNAKYHGEPFIFSPQVTLTAHCGTSPNAKAAFQFDYPNGGGATLENMIVNGCNQAVEVSANVVTFRNTYLQVGVTGLAKNTPLWIWDTFWVYFYGGGLTTSSTTAIPMMLMTGETCVNCYAGAGQFYMTGALLAGGPIEFIQDGNATGAPSGEIVIANTQWESGNGDFFKILNPSGYTFFGLQNLTLDSIITSDNMSSSYALIDYEAANTTLSGVHINASSAPIGIRMNASGAKLNFYTVTGCATNCLTTPVSDGSGNAVGSGMAQNNGGFDLTEDGDALLGKQLQSQVYSSGPAVRITKGGRPSASVALGADLGLGFGNPNVQGFNATLSETTPGQLDFSFAANYPPTNVAATSSNSGGSFSAGTYYLYVVSTLTSACTPATNFSAPSNIVGPLTITTGTTGSFAVTWTPAQAGTQAIAGYCVLVGSSSTYSTSNYSSNFISGASTASATVTYNPINPGVNLPITQNMQSKVQVNQNGVYYSGAPYLNAPPTDSFTRPNASTLGANWSITESSGGASALVISGNMATAQGTAYGVETWTAQTFLANQFSRATVAALANGATDGVDVVVRGTGTATRTNYEFGCGNNTSYIRKAVAGTFTTLATGGACAVSNVIELDVVGSSTVYLTATVNGAITMTAVDSSSPITTGQPGIEVYNSSDGLTNWVGGSLLQGNGSQAFQAQPNTYTAEQNFAAGAVASQFVGSSGTPLIMSPEPNSSSPGTASQQLAKFDSSGNLATAGTGDQGVPTFVVTASQTAQGTTYCAPGTSGSACIVAYGNASLQFDAGGGTIGHYVTASSTTGGRGHDSGSSIPSGTCVVGILLNSPAANAVGTVFALNFCAGAGSAASDVQFTTATTSVSANSCDASATTVTVTGLTTTMAVTISPSSDTSAVTGWGATGGLVLDAWPSAANTLSYKRCNQTSSSITPGAVTWNVSGR